MGASHFPLQQIAAVGNPDLLVHPHSAFPKAFPAPVSCYGLVAQGTAVPLDWQFIQVGGSSFFGITWHPFVWTAFTSENVAPAQLAGARNCSLPT